MQRLREPFAAQLSKRISQIFFLSSVFLAEAMGQKGSCPDGLYGFAKAGSIRLDITLCPALQRQDPKLAAELTKVLETLQGQGQTLQQFTRNFNSIGKNLELEQQNRMLHSLLSELIANQKSATQSQAGDRDVIEKKLAALSDGLSDIQSRLLQALADKKTAGKAGEVLEGPVGDAIAKLDLQKADDLLTKELLQIHTVVDKIDARTEHMEGLMNRQALIPALVAADTAALNGSDFRKGGLESLESGLSQAVPEDGVSVAQHFFERAVNNSEALKWFDSMLAAGLDPDLRVSGKDYKTEALLVQAVRAGNASAAEILLRHGAHPHAYQDIVGTSNPGPRFLFPLQSIGADMQIAKPDKHELTKAFMDSGAVLADVLPPRGSGWESVMNAAKAMRDNVAPTLGINWRPTTTVCDQPASVICERASSREHQNWCGIVAKTPKHLSLTGSAGASSSSAPFYGLELLYLLNVEHDNMYFLGLISSYGPDYVLVEVAKDQSRWNVIRYMEGGAGLGTCSKGDPVRDRCWRSIPLQRIPGTNQVRFDAWGVNWDLDGRGCSPAKVAAR